MPLLDTTGNNTADAYQGGSAVVSTYIEDVFSTYLYTGTGASQTITNGIDLSTKGGLTWIKSRSAATNNCLFDTARGATKYINSNLIAVSTIDANGLTAFNTTGFTLGTGGTTGDEVNVSAATYASWSFRKQPKFFDVVTYTGTGSNTTIAHNLGSVPGCIIVKRTDATGGWGVYHNSLTSAAYRLLLNSAAIQVSDAGYWNSTAPTSTVFSIGNTADVNASGGTYVAYIFAHNAGGFGLTGTDNVISCGGFSVVSGAASVTLGYEPQYIMYKNKSGTIDNWTIMDNMRGFNSATAQPALFPNTSNAESSGYALANATGFTMSGAADATYIYIAIRRGPMKVPTDATKVLSLNFETTSTNPQTLTTGFPVDVSIVTVTSGTSRTVSDRLRGSSTTSASWVLTDSTAAEVNYSGIGFGIDNNTAIIDAAYVQPNTIFWNLRRSPNFCDVVCYTGDGTAGTRAHNLSAIPELILLKSRSNGYQWVIYSSALGNGKILAFSTATPVTFNAWNSTNPTSSNFSVSSGSIVNNYNSTFVAYLFATCPGVSKVGSYTGTGTLTTINCGFTGGARFVLIKRTDTTANWCLWDTTRGMVSGTDPSLYLNGSAAQSNANSVYTATTGFQLLASPVEDVNTSGGSYIFLAIA